MDCLDGMKQLEDESIDAVITVPPPQKANGFSRWMNAIYLYIPMIYLLLCLADIATKTPAYIS